MIRVFLLLGSNEGDRENFLLNARFRIQLLAGKSPAVSSVYETAAWGDLNQAPFLNQVLAVDTTLNPRILLSTLLAIEDSLGRKRTKKWAARTIDIDILFYGEQVITDPDLIIPHPEIGARRFALTPLAELIPDFVHPVLKKSVSELLVTCEDRLEVREWSKK